MCFLIVMAEKTIYQLHIEYIFFELFDINKNNKLKR